MNNDNIRQSMHNQIKNLARQILDINKKKKKKRADIESGDTNLFFRNMFGDNYVLITKVMQSLQTTFGMAFYEQACAILGQHVGYEVRNQFILTGNISIPVSSYIERLLNNYNYIPNRTHELAELDQLSQLLPDPQRYPDSIVDVFIKKPNGDEIYIDITTVKPNKKEFRAMKRKSLEWYALRKSTANNVNVKPYIAIPYNPESLTTNNYTRHAGQYDRQDLLVGDELWNLASNGIFGLSDMNRIFQELGEETRMVINSALQR